MKKTRKDISALPWRVRMVRRYAFVLPILFGLFWLWPFLRFITPDTPLTPRTYSICLQGFNHTERSIASFSVNDMWGGNVRKKEPDENYGGGGKLSCGGSIRSGGKVKVKWTYELKSVEELDAGVIPESHEVTVDMPKADTRRARYFQVHFFPDNHVELKLTTALQ